MLSPLYFLQTKKTARICQDLVSVTSEIFHLNGRNTSYNGYVFKMFNTKNLYEQVCIPVGCVPPTAIVVGGCT